MREVRNRTEIVRPKDITRTRKKMKKTSTSLVIVVFKSLCKLDLTIVIIIARDRIF